MRRRTILRYSEVILILGAILTPIIFFTTPLSITYRYASVDLKEGDIIQVTINDYTFNYQTTGLESYNITPGIYLYPTVFIEDGERVGSGSILLFEGNSSSSIELNFRVTAIIKKHLATYAYVMHEETGFQFILNPYVEPAYTPFVVPYLTYGLTFSYEGVFGAGNYVCWHSIFLFSTQNTREALNWHSRNSGYLGYDFAKEDTNTFKTALNENYSGHSFFSLTTWQLKNRSDKLLRVTSSYEGFEQLTLSQRSGSRIFNFTANEDIFSYWSYNMDIELKYFRGGKEI
ncbi:MAG: hypothetical protein ACTSQ4_05890 [Candidatus Heimdallarchaeaceae archaeon]